MINDYIGNIYVGLLDGLEYINIDFLLLFIDYILLYVCLSWKKKINKYVFFLKWLNFFKKNYFVVINWWFLINRF